MVNLRIFGFFMVAISVASAAGPNIFCLTWNCHSALHSCRSNTDCNKALDCLQKCHQTDRACNSRCMNSYENPTFDHFMNCAATQHSCIHVDTSHNVHCKAPHAIETFHMSSLEGTWYTVKGMTSATDCFDCQVSVFAHGSGSHYSVHKTYDVLTIEGHHKQHNLVENVEQKSPGQLHLTGMTNGLHHSETWYILAASSNYMYFYYCGNTGGSVYEGALVLSKTDSLTSAELQEVTQAATSNGFNMANYCTPSTSSCHDFHGNVVG